MSIKVWWKKLLKDRKKGLINAGVAKGFKEAETVYKERLEALQATIEQEVAKRMTQKLRIVNPFDVLKVNKGQVLLGGTLITPQEVQNLKAEIETLKQFRIWSMFQETLKQYAIDMAFADSKSYEEVLGGKMMGHCIGIMKTITEIIEKL